MKSFNTLSQVLRYLSEAHKTERTIVARMGLRTNGDLHLGNVFPLIVGTLLGSKIVKKGYEFRFVIYLVDQENGPEDLPFNKIPYNNKLSLADYSIFGIKKFVGDVQKEVPDIEVVYKKVSDIQKQKKFRILLKNILKKDKRINLQALCQKHGGKIKGYLRKDTFIFLCAQCGKKFSYFLYDKKLELMLDHDVLGVIEDNLFPIDIHIIGRDHTIVTEKNDSALEFREKLQKVLGVSKHITFLTPLVLGKDKKKMSKSNETGLFLSQIRNENYSIQNIVDFVSKNVNKKNIEVPKFMYNE